MTLSSAASCPARPATPPEAPPPASSRSESAWSRSAAVALALLGFVLHGAPYVTSPFGTDVNWAWRLQTLDPDGAKASALPDVFRRLASGPTSGTWAGFVAWHELTGRYNVLDVAALRFIAWAAPDSPFGWKMFSLAFALGATGLFFATLRRLGVGRELAWWTAAVSLFVIADDYWIEYKAAEPRAALFFLLSLWCAIGGRARWHDTVAAAAMGAAVLTKETFAAGWILIGAAVLARARVEGWTLGRARGVAVRHLIVAAGCVMFFLAVRLTHPVRESGYAVNEGGTSLAGSVRGLVTTFVPPAADLLPVMLGALVLGWTNRVAWSDVRKTFREMYADRFHRFLLGGLVVHAIAHVAIYWVGGRGAGGRYAVPLNYTMLLAAALVIDRVQPRFSLNLGHPLAPVWVAALAVANVQNGIVLAWTNVFVASWFVIIVLCRRKGNLRAHAVAAFLLAACADRFIYPKAFSFLHENETFERLIADLRREAPARATVVFRVDDAYMNEIVQSAEANLLLGTESRTDLAFRFEPSEPSRARLDGFVQRIIRVYNDRDYSGDRPTLIVRADRRGVFAREEAKIGGLELLRSPLQLVRHRYAAGRQVRGINYTLERAGAKEPS